MSGTVRPVDSVGVRLRIDVKPERSIPFVDIDLGPRSVSLTPAAVRALMAGLAQMLDLAETFESDEQQAGRGQGEPQRFCSELGLTFEVDHDGYDRTELLEVVAARIEAVLRREGVECFGWSEKIEPGPVERYADEEPEGDDSPRDERPAAPEAT